jgi:5-oxopent-3-ene-1,2,5-tricarboxylate decarboxylase / 2-hydroxyhepta-2,4-diene-1,7-dioate isomerase
MPDSAIAQLRNVPTATVKQILRELGVDRTFMRGLRSLTSDRRIAGKARTLRFLPIREDAKPPNKGVNRRLIDTLERDDVLVIDAAGNLEGAVLGDMLAARAHARGAAGVVADGVIRDVDGIREIGLAVWARGTYPDANSRELLAWETDIAIGCGGTLVQPGDYVVADSDGAVVVPPPYVEALLSKADELALEDEFSQQLLRGGASIDDAYPLPQSRRAEFEKFKATRLDTK